MSLAAPARRWCARLPILLPRMTYYSAAGCTVLWIAILIRCRAMKGCRCVSKRFRAVDRRLWQLLTPYWRLVARLLAAATLLVLTEGLGLSLVFFVLGSASLNNVAADFPWLATLWAPLATLTPAARIYGAAGALVLLMSVRGLAQYVQQVTETRLRINLELTLQQRLFDLLHAVQISFIHGRQNGTLTTTLLQHTVQIGQLIAGTARALSALLLFAAYATIALLISWQLSLIALVLMSLTGLGLRPLLLTRARRYYLQARAALEATGAIAQESLTGMEQIHLFNSQSWSKTRFHSQLARYHTLAFAGSQRAGLVAPLFGIVNAFLFALLMIASTLVAPANANLWIFQVTLFLGVAYRLNTPLNQLNQWQAQVTQCTSALDAVLGLLDDANLPLIQDGTQPFHGLQEGITFDAVSFCYADQALPSVTDITLQIPKGKVTALVGASGAGKSTLINLLARLYTPTAGRILVDGVDLQDFTLESWRARLAVVNQHPLLFHDSILANLQFSKADATPAQISQALDLAQARGFVAELPDGIYTSLQERGVRLSGGQRQRIALARALLREVDLLILDEATNELDAQTELAFQQALAHNRGARTILIIAHRLATVRHADQIYVLDAGRVVEQGDHVTLLARGGLYHQLVHAQLVSA